MGCETAEIDGHRKLVLAMNRAGQTNIKTEPLELSAAGRGMIDNVTYNLIEQLEIENKSLWRIQNRYKNDSSMDYESKQFWGLIEKDKEEVVRLLTEKVRERL